MKDIKEIAGDTLRGCRKITCRGLPLIKFKNASGIEELRNGIMHMRSLNQYREYAQKSLTIGDDYEALFHVNRGTMVIMSGGKEKVISVKGLNNALLPTTHSNDFAFCMFCFDNNLDRSEFTATQKSEMLTFGDTALIITDSCEFIKRIKIALQSKGIPSDKLYHGKVRYYDETVDSVNTYLSLLYGMQNVAFLKRNRYSYQQEYRFLIPNTENKNCYDLEIGSIHDISEVVKASQLLDSYVINQSNNKYQV